MSVRILVPLLFLPLLLFAACGDRSTGPANAMTTPEELHARLAADEEKPLVVDVREPFEYREGHIEGARLAPLGRVVSELQDVPKEREIVLVCSTDNRSGKAQRLLADRGYSRLENMKGGMVAWQKKGLPVVK
jgi:rhodanese-related sulfurtransferase